MATVGSTIQALKKRKEELEAAARGEVEAKSTTKTAPEVEYKAHTVEQLQQQNQEGQALLDSFNKKKKKAWYEVW